MEYLISLALIALSALFSGLTLGLLSLDTQTLKRRSELGDSNATAIYPLRRRGNQLLTTLLLGNVVVNTTLSIFLGSIVNGVLAVAIATTLIFLFGEIIPQAVISRYALWFGARTAPFVRVVMFIFYPIAKPIAYTLDRLLGHEIPTVYSHYELMQIVSEHEDSEHSSIDEDEERIIHGALQFSHMLVREVMTPADKVRSFDEHERLTDNFFEKITEFGFSRYPIYSGNENNIVGILFAKDLLTEENNIKIKNTNEAFEKDFIAVRPNEKLDVVLARMLKQKKHIGVVKTRNGIFSGVITLEDIIEEIIQQEIEDEDDD